jgi:hypothetical protein
MMVQKGEISELLKSQMNVDFVQFGYNADLTLGAGGLRNISPIISIMQAIQCHMLQ